MVQKVQNIPGDSQGRRTSSKARRKFSVHYLSLILLALTMACSRLENLAPEPTETLLPLASLTSTPTVLPLRFHVEGNTFMDQYGKPMVFRGMSAIDPIYQRYDDFPDHSLWSERYYREMAQWCANVIRLPILPSSVRNFGMEKTLETLDQTIAWAAENNMYVIINFHSLGWPPTDFYPPDAPWFSTTPQEMINFWEIISRRYAKNNTVAFYELFNEPATRASYMDHSGDSTKVEDWLVWKHLNEKSIAVIRANDPDKIILVGGLQFAYDLSYVPNAPITDKNVGYVTHPYSHPAWKKDWNTAFGDLSSQYPIFATEFGYDDLLSPDDDYNGIPYHETIIKYLEERRISWTVWNFDASWKPSLLLDNEAFNPSPSGKYFRSMMINLNQCP